MTARSYNTYVGSLCLLINEIRARTEDFNTSHVEVSIYRNGRGFKLCEDLVSGQLHRASYFEAIQTGECRPWSDNATVLEVDNFFGLKEFYAYSEKVMVGSRRQFLTARSDTAIAMINVAYRLGQLCAAQRMIFVGFSEKADAESILSNDSKLLVQCNLAGPRLYEWQRAPTQMI
ncbi:hypothetical protein AB4Z52_34590 [Rhizobium sp. 2YAF20]|uniref:hypothetical protein n=1 Tax=Rhizobium sp. 2YAF20 TaxID=3233027 RepID=UPI003F9508CC